MKNDADFNGPDVVPISWTAGSVDGKGFGSTYGVTFTSLPVCVDIGAALF